MYSNLFKKSGCIKQKNRLNPLKIKAFSTSYNGDNGIRTRDLCVANAALSQLSYVPMRYIIAQMEKITRTSWSGNQLSLPYYH